MMKSAAHPKLIPELYCSDYQRSLRFYTQVLGFTVDYAREEKGFAMLNREEARLMLDEIMPDKRTWVTAELELPFGRGINLQIEVSNVEALYKDVQDAKASIFLDLEERWYRANEVYVGNKQFIVLDPDGYMLRFYEDMGERAHP